MEVTEKKDLLFSNETLKKLIIPLILEQVLVISVGAMDTIMVSNAGEAAVSGVSLVDMINVLIINLFAALATGGAVISAQFLGQQDIKNACISAKQLVLITFLFSTVIMAVMLWLRMPMLHLFFGDIEQDVMESALIYLIITASSYPFIAVYNACAALFRAMGNSKVSMMTSLLMNVINVGGNAIFVYGFHMGAAGVAIPSLISRMVAAVIMLVLLSKKQNVIWVKWKEKLYLEKNMIKRILGIGIPNGLENSFFQLGKIIVVSIIAGFGTVQIAANAVANNIDSLGCIPGQALSLAMITVIGRCVGARDYEQASYYIKKLLKIAYATTIALETFLLVFLPWILKIYQLSAETTDLAMILIFIHNGCAMIMWPTAFTLPYAFRASNDVKFTMVVSIFSMWTFRILFSFFLGKYMGWGAIGVWIAMILDWVFRCICFLWRMKSGKWKSFAV